MTKKVRPKEKEDDDETFGESRYRRDLKDDEENLHVIIDEDVVYSSENEDEYYHDRRPQRKRGYGNVKVDTRLDRNFYHDNSCKGYIKRGLWNLWCFIFSFKRLLQGIIVVVVTITSHFTILTQNHDVEAANLNAFFTGLFTHLCFLIFDACNFKCARMEDPENENRKIFAPGHILSVMNFIVVITLFSVSLYLMIYIRMKCEGKNEECDVKGLFIKGNDTIEYEQ